MPPARRPPTAFEANLHARLEGVDQLLWADNPESGIYLVDDEHEEDGMIGVPSAPSSQDYVAGEDEDDDEDEDEDDDEEERQEDEEKEQVQVETQNDEEEEDDRDFPAGRIVKVIGVEQVVRRQGRRLARQRYDASRYLFSVELSDGTTLDRVRGSEIGRHNDGKLDDFMVKKAWGRDAEFGKKMAALGR